MSLVLSRDKLFTGNQISSDDKQEQENKNERFTRRMELRVENLGIRIY